MPFTFNTNRLYKAKIPVMQCRAHAPLPSLWLKEIKDFLVLLGDLLYLRNYRAEGISSVQLTQVIHTLVILLELA